MPTRAAHDQQPIAVSLFAGAGGLSEGLEAAGVRVPVAAELHPQPGLTFAFNHPNTTVFVGDLRQLSARTVMNAVRRRTGRRSIDIVAGGPPCQGFSSAGKKCAAVRSAPSRLVLLRIAPPSIAP